MPRSARPSPRRSTVLTSVLMLLAGSLWLAADDPPANRPDLPTLVQNADGISAVGRPNNYKLADPARYFVWHDSDGWHLRVTAPRNRSIVFKGAIRLHGAKFLAVRPIGIDKKTDAGSMSPDKTELTFQFTTSGKFDGFDFNLDAADESKIEFELLSFGRKAADRIFIGGKAANPKAYQFALDADP